MYPRVEIGDAYLAEPLPKYDERVGAMATSSAHGWEELTQTAGKLRRGACHGEIDYAVGARAEHVAPFPNTSARLTPVLTESLSRCLPGPPEGADDYKQTRGLLFRYGRVGVQRAPWPEEPALGFLMDQSQP